MKLSAKSVIFGLLLSATQLAAAAPYNAEAVARALLERSLAKRANNVVSVAQISQLISLHELSVGAASEPSPSWSDLSLGWAKIGRTNSSWRSDLIAMNSTLKFLAEARRLIPSLKIVGLGNKGSSDQFIRELAHDYRLPQEWIDTVSKVGRYDLIYLGRLGLGSAWQFPFWDEGVGDFHPISSEKLNKDFVACIGPFPIWKNRYLTGAVLPLGDTSKALALVVLAPAENTRLGLEKILQTKIRDHVEHPKASGVVEISLPVFEVVADWSVQEVLYLSEELSRVRGQSFPATINESSGEIALRVDSRGVATMEKIDRFVAPRNRLPKAREKLRFDSSFVFFVYDFDSDVCLFMGLVCNPEQPFGGKN